MTISFFKKVNWEKIHQNEKKYFDNIFDTVKHLPQKIIT